jgi:hypothetical protein
MTEVAVALQDHDEFPSLTISAANKGFLRKTIQKKVDFSVIQISNNSQRRLLRHCQSSPDLRSSDNYDAPPQFNVDDDDGDDALVVQQEGFSWRDAIVSKQRRASFADETDEKEPLQLPRFQPPKFVVRSITRCAKSTGDLHALSEEADVIGDTDAMDYYHRKALGVKGRANGAKLRPDEAKRKAITMHKKSLQRQANA